jgi:hypothetical protein
LKFDLLIAQIYLGHSLNAFCWSLVCFCGRLCDFQSDLLSFSLRSRFNYLLESETSRMNFER